MEDLIIHYRQIFDEPAAHSSPPLPPTPATDPVPQYYGSKNTKVGTMPPNNPVSAEAQGSPQDFTPRLPPRPASSIHPSSRTHGNTSPHKSRPDSQLPPLPADPEDDDIPSSPSPTAKVSRSDVNDDVTHSRNSSENTSQENRPVTPSSQKLYPFPATSTPDAPPSKADSNSGNGADDPFR